MTPLGRNDFPLQANRSAGLLLDVQVDSTGAGQTVVARLAAEDGEAEHREAALVPVG